MDCAQEGVVRDMNSSRNYVCKYMTYVYIPLPLPPPAPADHGMMVANSNLSGAAADHGMMVVMANMSGAVFDHAMMVATATVLMVTITILLRRGFKDSPMPIN